MKITLGVLLLLTSFLGGAQFLQDVSGKPYLQNAVDEYEGSPFLFQAWAKADVTSSAGKIYKDMLVNIDLVQDLPIFQRDGKVYTFSEPVNEFTISDATVKLVFKRGSSISSGLPNTLLEVVNEAPLFLKKHERNLVDVPTYGGTTKRFRYAENKSYYAVVDSAYKKISLTKENAEKIFSQHWKDAAAYAKLNDISFKSEEGWRKLLKYYTDTLIK